MTVSPKGLQSHEGQRQLEPYTEECMLPNLENLLAYQNPNVIKLFKRDFPNKAADAEKLFQNLLKYLWLCKKHSYDKKNNPQQSALQFICVMHLEMQAVDDMWHTFILFTKDYADFCQQYFGEFLHHIPNIVEEQPAVFGDFTVECSRYLSYVYDHLGEATVREWFAEHLTDD